MNQQKQLLFTKNAFAFQNVHYFPFAPLMKIVDPVWNNIARELEKMYDSTEVDPTVTNPKAKKHKYNDSEMIESHNNNQSSDQVEEEGGDASMF